MLSALFRRETNCTTPADRRRFLCYAEDLSATSCHSTRSCLLSENPRSTFLICFSSDMCRMASSHGDHTVRVVDCKSGRNTHTLKGHPRTPWCVAFHPSSNDLLASGCLGGQVRVWDLKGGGSEVYTPADQAVIASLAFHPVDQVLLIATSNKLVFWKWTLATPILTVETASPERKVRFVKFSPLGDHILTGVTNIAARTPSNPTGPAVRDSSSMQQFLQSVNCSRIGSDQVAAYVLQPSAGSGPSTSAQVTPTPPPNSRATTSGSEQSERDRPDPATREGASQSGDNSAQTSTDTADRAGPGSSREGSSADWRNPANGDYRGVFAIFRARDSGSWNLDESDIDSEPSDVQPVAGSLLFDRRVASSEPRDLGSDPDASDVSLSVNSERSSLFAGEPTGEDSVSFRSPAYWAAESSNPDPSTASTRSGVDGAWGVGRVINVGGSPRPAHQGTHASSSHSSSFSNIGNQEAGGGTAVATATARTFRHVHTAVVVTDGTNGGPQLALSTAINRAIAGAFAGSGEGAVASNIINTTHRLQWWRCEEMQPPDLKDGEANVIVKACKIHNDASCDISSDGTMLAAFVPSQRGFPNDGELVLHSLAKDTLGQCLFRKKFGPNAISVNLSPLGRYVMVGLAARRLHWHLTSQQLVAQIFRLDLDKKSGYPQDLDKPVNTLTHDCQPSRRSHVSVNAAFWNPVVGSGIVYGTNRGHLKMREVDLRPKKH